MSEVANFMPNVLLRLTYSSHSTGININSNTPILAHRSFITQENSTILLEYLLVTVLLEYLDLFPQNLTKKTGDHGPWAPLALL